MLFRFIMSRVSPTVGLWVAKLLPRASAYRMGDLVATLLGRRANSPLVRAVRGNLSVVYGTSYEDPALEPRVEAVLRNSAHGFVDLFKAMSRGQEGVLSSCKLEPRLDEALNRGLREPRGLVIIGPHLVGFDIFLLYLGVKGHPIQTLSFPDPRGSYMTQNAMRIRFGLELTPISVHALRKAMYQLRRGKAIMTAVDRPGLGGVELEFFGRPVQLPIGHARLAYRTGSPILVGIPESRAAPRYEARMGGWIEPPESGNEREAARQLAQSVLQVLESAIADHPERWMMFYPLWPEVLPGFGQ